MKRTFLLLTTMLIAVTSLFAQTKNSACMGWHNPSDFTSTGTLATWRGYTGTKNSVASNCTMFGYSGEPTTVSAANLATTTGGSSCYNTTQSDYQKRFVIKNAGAAPETGNVLSYLPPDTSFVRSIRIGNYCGGTEWEALEYEFTVSAQNALFTIWYALSLYDAKHTAAYNPEFVIHVQVQNPSTLAWEFISDTFCFVQQTPVSGTTAAQVTNMGFGTSSAGGHPNVYKPWNKVVINLYKFLYRNVRITMASGDCAYSAHYGAAYVAGDCEPMMLTASGCAAGESDFVGTIYAPDGMNHYTWYRSTSGILSSEEARNNNSNYTSIATSGQTHDTNFLGVELQHFITSNGDTSACNTFKCVLQSEMNPGKPINSTLFVDVCNTKPILALDSVLYCDGEVVLTDRSQPLQISSESDRVDTANTLWTWYNVDNPRTTGAIALATTTGGTASYTYEDAGSHSVVVRTTAFDTSCWNQKTVKIRSLAPMTPVIELSKNNLCAGDTITVTDQYRQGSTWRRWHIFNNDIDTTFEGTGANTLRTFNWVFDQTTTIELTAHNSDVFMRDTNLDGELDPIHCLNSTSIVVNVQSLPVVTITGETIVCNGEQSTVSVSTTSPDCTYRWLQLGNPDTLSYENTLVTRPTNDVSYCVQVKSSFGCITWDTFEIAIVKPALYFSGPYDPKPEICTGDTIKLWGGKAASFEWSCSPQTDATFWGQENSDTIWVSPIETTVYSVVGHGSNGCSATALNQQITVHPYPQLAIELTPGYIDSENPSVQFSDVSLYSSTSLWNFGAGQTSPVRSVVWTFTDLSQDSLQIGLTSYNPLGCSRDTSFWVPVTVFTVWYPNAFTPRMETNNTFRCYTANELLDYELAIYDRNGLLMFYSNDPEAPWDGTYKGEECMEGTYVYIAHYRRPGQARLMSQKGTVILLK